MRLPLVPPIESRDGTGLKDGQCRNLLVNSLPTGVSLAELRPSLVVQTSSESPKSGNGLVEFNGELLSVYDATLAIADVTPEPVISFTVPEFLVVPYDDEYFVPQSIANSATEVGYSDIVVAGQKSGTVSNIACIWTETGGFVEKFDEYSNTAQVFVSDDGEVFGIGEETETSETTIAYATLTGPVSYLPLPAEWMDIDALTSISNYESIGSILCGYGTIPPSGVRGLIYRPATKTIVNIGVPSGAVASLAFDVSAQEVVVGRYYDAGNFSHPFKWASSSGFVDLGTLGGAPSSSSDISADFISEDASIIYGRSRAADGSYRGFYWTQNTGMLDLNPSLVYSSIRLYSIAKQSGHLVGSYLLADNTSIGFIWRLGVGFTTITKPGAQFNTAQSVASDGSIVCGSSRAFGGEYTQWKWTEANGLVEFGVVSDDANIMLISSRGDSFVGSGGIPDGAWVVGGHDVLPRFRSLADLEDQFFDFAQSTL